MGRHRFVVHVGAPRDLVFELWTDLGRAPEWIGGLTRITDVTGPADRAGTRYTGWFGRMSSVTEIIDAERPRFIRSRLLSGILRGTTQALFEDEDGGTRLTQEFQTQGLIPAVFGRIFSLGAWGGSFRGELNAFARLAEREAAGR